MIYNPLIHHRHSLRRKGYDYSSEGAYFVTICSHNPGNIFGHIENGKMYLNEYGVICNNEWLNTPIIRPNVELVAHIVMPDHFHALFIIKQKSNQRYIGVSCNGETQFPNVNVGELCDIKNEPCIHRGVLQYAPVDVDNAPMGVDNIPMGAGNAHADDCIEFTFQSQYAPLTDDEINEIRKMPHSPSQTVGAIVRGFKSSVTKQINILRGTPQMPVWQRNYHEYIITSERFFNNVANYILQNPERWGEGENNIIKTILNIIHKYLYSSRRKPMSEVEKLKFIPDEAINLAKVGKDLLNTAHYVSTLKKIIDSHDDENKSKTIGLFGAYGSGKSSIIETIKEKYRDDKRVKVILYDAWKYSGDSFRRTFLINLYDELDGDHKKLEEQFYKTETTVFDIIDGLEWKKIIKPMLIILGALAIITLITYFLFSISEKIQIALLAVLISVILSGIISVLMNFANLLNTSYKTTKKSETTQVLFAPEQFQKLFCEKVNEHFESKDHFERIVIVVDNLDRCQPSVIYSVLTDIKGFLEVDNRVITIVPIDEQIIIKHCEDNKDYTVSPNELLRKIFNFHVVVKPYSRMDYFDYVKKLNEEYSLGFNNETINIIAREFVNNPRRIIQICNNLTTEINSLRDRYSLNNENKKNENINKTYSNPQKQCSSDNNHIEDIDKFLNDNQSLICKLLVIREEFPEFYKMIFKDSRILINDDFRKKMMGEFNNTIENNNTIDLSKFELFLKYTPDKKYDEITIQRIIFNQPISIKLPNRILYAIELSDVDTVIEYIKEGENENEK